MVQPDRETYWGVLRYLANGKGKLRTFESGMGSWNSFVDFCLICDFGRDGNADEESVSSAVSELRHCAILPVWYKCRPSDPPPSSASSLSTLPIIHPYPYPNLTSLSLRVLSAQIYLLPFLPHFLSIQGPLLHTIYLYVVDPPALASTLELIGEYCGSGIDGGFCGSGVDGASYGGGLSSASLTKVVLDVPERVWSVGDYGFISEKLPIGVRYLGLRMEWNGPEESDGWEGAEDLSENGKNEDCKERERQAAFDEERRKVVWESVFRVLSGRSAFRAHSSSGSRFLHPGLATATHTDGLDDGTGGGLRVIRILEKHWCAWLRGRQETSLGSNGEGDGEWCRELKSRGVRVEDMWGVEYGI